MNKVLPRAVIASVLAAVLTACPGGGAGGADKGSGKLQGWPSGSTGRLEFYGTPPSPAVLRASADVDASGNFSYALPSPITPLESLDSPGPCAPLSNPSARAASIFGLGGIVAYVGAAASPTGLVVISSSSPGSGSTPRAGDQLLYAFLFLDSDTNIVGTCTSGGSTQEYDLKLKAGWNLIIVTAVEVSGGSTTKIKWTSSTGSVPTTLKWWYVPLLPPLKGLKLPSSLWDPAW